MWRAAFRSRLLRLPMRSIFRSAQEIEELLPPLAADRVSTSLKSKTRGNKNPAVTSAVRQPSNVSL